MLFQASGLRLGQPQHAMPAAELNKAATPTPPRASAAAQAVEQLVQVVMGGSSTSMSGKA